MASGSSGSELIRSSDREQAVELISGVFSAHSLEVLGPSEEFDVLVRARRTPTITIAFIRHGTEVLVRPGHLQSYYEINVPLAGFTTSSCGPDEVQSDATTGVVLTPTEDASMRWSSDCEQLAVKVSRSVVERTVEGLLGHPPDEAVQFAVGLDLASAPGRNWLRAVGLLRDSLEADAPELVIRPLEELVVGQLLVAQPHNFSDQLAGGPRPPRPRALSRVIELIEKDPQQAMTVSDMARVGGTSVRSLQAAFADQLSTSPAAYLRSVRLARAHQDLVAAQPGDGLTVADIAFRWGFGHVPRFAAAYRDRYGEAPSQTLRT